MPIENILYLALVLGALVEFAVVLTHAEWASKRALAATAPTLVHSNEAPTHRTAAHAVENTAREKAA